MSSATLFQIQSSIILLLMYVGVIFRHNRQLHVKLMGTAMIWDVLLILQIELTRDAIIKAADSMMGSKSLILNVHVAMAVTCVILYGFMVAYGRRLLRGENAVRKRHRRLGITTLTLRTLVFITSFFVVNHHGVH